MTPPSNPLQLGAINVVLAGDGGIGRALAQRLLADYPVEQLFCLQRNKDPITGDPRCITLPVDVTDPASISAAGSVIGQRCDALHLVINTVGMLHAPGIKPEKRLRDVTASNLQQLALVNAFFLPQLAAALAPGLRHGQPSLLASLSARVGSISDNSMGGWYAYRASKAAHNQLLRTLALEWRLSHRHCCVVALHPGTVKTQLSEPFTPANYRKAVHSPDQCAQHLLNVMSSLSSEQSGEFYDWKGDQVPW